MVEDDGDPLPVKDAVETGLLELVDGHRGGDVVAQDDVQFGVDELTGLDLIEAGVVGEDLLCQCHSHGGAPYLLLMAETSARMPATMMSVSVPAPQVAVPSPQTRPT